MNPSNTAKALEALEAHGPIDEICEGSDECLAQNVLDLLAEIDALKAQIPEYVRRGAHSVIPAKERELHRARQAEALLREATALLRNDPNMQGWRARAIEQLKRFGRYDDTRAKPSDLVDAI